jgi:hypothetical protein
VQETAIIAETPPAITIAITVVVNRLITPPAVASPGSSTHSPHRVLARLVATPRQPQADLVARGYIWHSHFAPVYPCNGPARVRETVVVLLSVVRPWGADHLNTLVSRNNLALRPRVDGRLAEAIPPNEQTLADSERVLGEDHVTTITIRNGRASAVALQEPDGMSRNSCPLDVVK